MQDRSERFKQCLNKFLKQGDTILVSKQKSNRLFSPDAYMNDRRIYINDCINSLEQYEKNLSSLIDKESKNKKYYEAHLDGLVNMLETIQSKKLCEVDSTDFKIIVPHTIDYHRSQSDMDVHSLRGCHIGALVGALLSLGIVVPLLVTGVGAGFIPVAILFLAALGALIGALIGSNNPNCTSYPRESDRVNCELLADLSHAYEILKTADLPNNESEKVNACSC